MQRTPRPQLGLSSEQVELQLWWGVTVSQSTGDIIILADSVVPTGVSFGNLAAMKLRCLPLFFLAGATRVQCDACAEKEGGNVQVKCFISGAVACWRRLWRAENSEAATRKRCAPDTARHGGEIVPLSMNSLLIATAIASAGAKISTKGRRIR